MTSTTTRPRTLPCTADQVIRWAVAQQGKTEDPPGSNRTPWGQEYGMNGVAWCGIFGWAALKHGGGVDLRAVLGGGTEYTPRFAQLCERAGWPRVRVDQARAGDFAFLGFRGGREGIEHFALVRGQGSHPDGLRTVEGNTSAGDGSQTNGGAVALKERPARDIVVIYRPPFAASAVHAGAQRYTLHRTLRLRRLALMHGNDVRAVQRLVGSKVDGWYGPDTHAKVAAWQRLMHIPTDGIFGPQSAHAAGWNYAD